MQQQQSRTCPVTVCHTVEECAAPALSGRMRWLVLMSLWISPSSSKEKVDLRHAASTFCLRMRVSFASGDVGLTSSKRIWSTYMIHMRASRNAGSVASGGL